jgi:3-isopropylmalate/(R)-2-methylmalate dehydratase small subunit
VLVCEEAVLNSEDGQELDVNLETGTIYNITTGQTFQAEPLDPFVARIVAAGGIINYIEQEGTLR